MNKIVFTLIFCFSTQLNNLTAKNTSCDFLKIDISARQAGMGGAFCAIADDVAAIHFNPAGVSQIKQAELLLTHTKWIVDTNINFIGFLAPLKTFVLGGSIVYLSYAEIEARDDNQQKIGTFSANDLAATISFSKQLLLSNKDVASYGINMKIIRQQIEKEQSVGVAFDLGLLTSVLLPTLSHPISIGFSIQNISQKMKFIKEEHNLPLTAILGFGYRVGVINFAIDFKHRVYERKTIFSFGTEYFPTKFVSLRLGYTNKDIVEQKHDNLLNFCGGFGINLFNRYQIDYTFLPYGVLGDTHKFSFLLKF